MTNRHLRAVAKARREQDQARDRLVASVRAAVEAGVPRARLADTLGVNRVTLWRWLDPDPEKNSPRAVAAAGDMATSEDPDAAAAA